MINSLEIKYGDDKNDKTLTIDLNNITIFVGPNNSGKSLILKEIETHISQGTTSGLKIFKGIDITLPSYEKALEEITTFKIRSQQLIPDNHLLVGKLNMQGGNLDQRQINTAQFKQYFDEGTINKYILQNYIWLFMIRLDGNTRFSLIQPRSSGDLSGSPLNHLMHLFMEDEARVAIREIIADAFELYFVIDPTHMTQFKIRLSEKKPEDNNEEQSLDSRSRIFHSEALDIAEASDGIKAFTGLVSALYSSNFRIMLVDEPEAFLHPPLARKLGLRLATVTPSRKANLLVSTHSADFIMGCIQSGEKINIVRLTYNKKISTARLLCPDELIPLMRDPMLRSTGVLSSLFHESVIITEADTDRAFYQEINERLLAAERNGIKDCLFLNAQNLQTIYRIMKPLNELGISVAAIVDIDVIGEGGSNWTKLLEAAAVPPAVIQSLNILRSKVKESFDKLGYDMKRIKTEGGINILTGTDKESCESLLSQLSKYGVFVVSIGELESWLKDLGVSGHGPSWLTPVFEKMGSNPDEADYKQPGPDDVWLFIEQISEWFANK